MVNIPEIWPIYQKYGQSTINIVSIPEIWSTYQKYCQHTAKKELGNISGKKI